MEFHFFCLSVSDSYLNLHAKTGIIKVAWLRQTETRRVLFSPTVMNNACVMGHKRMLKWKVPGVLSTRNRNNTLPLLCCCSQNILIQGTRNMSAVPPGTTIKTLPVNFMAPVKESAFNKRHFPLQKQINDQFENVCRNI